MFIYVVDTEGDNEWTQHRRLPPVRNALALPRFQTLCDRYGIKPTYVVTWSYVAEESACAPLKEFCARGAAEVGTHLHPWTCPPWSTPWDDSETFPSELPDPLLEEKLTHLTHGIKDRFGRSPTSYRAGRFGFDGRSARILQKLGYTVDSSVTPLKSWSHYTGIPGGPGGPDFSRAPLRPYWLDLTDPTRPGDSKLLEIPLTIVDQTRLPTGVDTLVGGLPEEHLVRRVLAKARLRRRLWLRPTVETVEAMVASCGEAQAQGVPIFNMMIHSSELFANTSPYFPDQASVDRLFDRMDRTFDAIFKRWSPDPVTLTQAGEKIAALH